MYGEEGQHNGGNTCYMVNNKNIKHVANPKEGGNEDTVKSEGLQKKKREMKRTKGISFWYQWGNIVRSVKKEAQ